MVNAPNRFVFISLIFIAIILISLQKVFATPSCPSSHPSETQPTPEPQRGERYSTPVPEPQKEDRDTKVGLQNTQDRLFNDGTFLLDVTSSATWSFEDGSSSPAKTPGLSYSGTPGIFNSVPPSAPLPKPPSGNKAGSSHPPPLIPPPGRNEFGGSTKVDAAAVKQKPVESPPGDGRDYESESTKVEFPNLVITLPNVSEQPKDGIAGGKEPGSPGASRPPLPPPPPLPKPPSGNETGDGGASGKKGMVRATGFAPNGDVKVIFGGDGGTSSRGPVTGERVLDSFK